MSNQPKAQKVKDLPAKKYKIDQSSLNFKEIIEVEEIAEMPLALMADEERPKGRALLALAYISIKRDNPDITLEEVELMGPEDFIFVGAEEAEDPTSASA